MKRLLSVALLLAGTLAVKAQFGVDMVANPTPVGIDMVITYSDLGSSNLPVAECPATCYAPLAVTGVELKAERATADKVLLQWHTLTESNNKGFYVESSLGNTTSFRDISFVPGVGYSTAKVKYSLTDNNDFEGTTYYRLRQVDNDGHFVYSNIASVKGVSQNRFAIWPNPATSYCRLVFDKALAGKKLQVTIYDAAGKIAMQRSYTGDASGNINIQQLPLLAPATYLVTVTDGSTVYFGKLSIAR